jgi:hypothetical protein
VAEEEDNPTVKCILKPVYPIFTGMEDLKYDTVRDQTKVVTIEEGVLKSKPTIAKSLDVFLHRMISIVTVKVCPISNA